MEDEKELRQDYEPPAFVFEQVVEALAATCTGGDTCDNKESNGTCYEGGVPQQCSAFNS